MKKIYSFGFVALLLSFLCTGIAQSAEPIKFGFVHSLSGGIGQVYGVPDLAGVKMAVDEINRAGGVLGRPLEVTERDDKLSPETGVREAKDLVLWCNGPACGQSPRAIHGLIEVGYPPQKLFYYRGGMQLWQLFGLTTALPEG